MFLHSSRRTPLRMEERVIFAVVGSGQRGLPVCLHVRQVLAQRAGGSGEPREVCAWEPECACAAHVWARNEPAAAGILSLIHI